MPKVEGRFVGNYLNLKRHLSNKSNEQKETGKLVKSVTIKFSSRFSFFEIQARTSSKCVPNSNRSLFYWRLKDYLKPFQNRNIFLFNTRFTWDLKMLILHEYLRGEFGQTQIRNLKSIIWFCVLCKVY